MAHHQLQTYPIILRRVQVARTRDITPRMRRVTLTGDQLAAFTRDGLELAAFTAPGFDDHIKLIFASNGDIASALPRQLEHGIEWVRTDNRLTRDYTPRRFDPDSRELDLDFVLHGHGPAVRWARSAKPGDELWFVGPKSSTIPPADVDWIVLAGDETALPAIGRFLEERPLDVPAQIVLTISDSAAEQQLPLRDGDTIRWILADSTDGPELEKAVRELEWWPGQPYIWCAGESRALLAIRRYFARECGVAKSHLDITGYWHAERSEQPPQATAALPALDPAGYATAATSWLAIRAALELGVLEPVGAGPIGTNQFAQACGVPVDRLRPLIDELVRSEVLASSGNDRVSLGRLGELLLDDEHTREQFVGQHADLILSLSELAPALRGGETAWRQRHGRSLRTELEADAARYDELVDEAGRLRFLVFGMSALDVWKSADRIAVTGPGSTIVADHLRTEGKITAATIVESPGPLSVLAEQPIEHNHEFSSSWPSSDVAVSVLGLGQRSDDEVAALLRELAAAASRAVLIDALHPDELSSNAAQQALLEYAGTGASARTTAWLREVAAQAGWSELSAQPLGWGVEVFELRR